MINYKRITLLCGHYGSGKTNIAVNMALDLASKRDNVAIADLDIVNPYFRTKDSQTELEKAGIRLICSDYANTNVDIPALPAEIYTITDDKNLKSVVDIGGDDRGAYVLGRISEKIVSENDYDMLMVINSYRPLTRDAQSTMEVLNEIETAAKIKFTGLINNSNLGEETTPEDVLASLEYAQSVSKATGLPVVATTVKVELYEALQGKIENLFPLKLQDKIM
jgi:septum formation inhibitor-activating ATPase MinD